MEEVIESVVEKTIEEIGDTKIWKELSRRLRKLRIKMKMAQGKRN